MAFVERALEVEFKLGTGSFGASGFNTVRVKDLRAHAAVSKAGGMQAGSLMLRVWGMKRSTMNQLSTLGLPPSLDGARRNFVTVYAGDRGSVLSPVFTGIIQNAWIDAGASPEIAFVVSANQGVYDALAPIPVTTSSQKGVKVADMLSGLATRMSLKFENNGVTQTLNYPYYSGTARVQALKIVEDAGIEWNSCNDGTLAIWPKGGNRGGLIPVISPSPGTEVGYPAFQQIGIRLRALYDPSVTFGGLIKVQGSMIEGANATWWVNDLKYDLACYQAGGPWFMDISANTPGSVAPTPRS